LHRRDRVALGVGSQQAVLVLRRDQSGEAVLARGAVGLGQLRTAHVGAADKADLALAHQIVERAQGLLDRRLRVGPVQLVEIDPFVAAFATSEKKSLLLAGRFAISKSKLPLICSCQASRKAARLVDRF
jgi:hypothetical protein